VGATETSGHGGCTVLVSHMKSFFSSFVVVGIIGVALVAGGGGCSLNSSGRAGGARASKPFACSDEHVRRAQRLVREDLELVSATPAMRSSSHGGGVENRSKLVGAVLLVRPPQAPDDAYAARVEGELRCYAAAAQSTSRENVVLHHLPLRPASGIAEIEVLRNGRLLELHVTSHDSQVAADILANAHRTEIAVVRGRGRRVGVD